MPHTGFILTFCLALSTSSAFGQPQAADPTTATGSNQAASSSSALPDAPAPADDNAPVTIPNTFVHTFQDQPKIFTSPLRIKKHDLIWLAPIAGGTAAAFALDQRTMQTVVTQDPDFNKANMDVSNGMIGGLIAVPVVLLGAGEFTHNPHAREAGLLGGEAMVDGLIVEQVIKLATFRERPNDDHGAGKFYITKTGANSSFPSGHGAIAWSAAALIAAEYPSKWVQTGVYTLATGVSLTRVLGQAHFPSDVLVGSTLGWLIGHYVYKAHHSVRGTSAADRRQHITSSH